MLSGVWSISLRALPEAVHMTASLFTFTSDAAGFDTHSFWLDTGSEVVVFDAQFTEELVNQVAAR